MINGSLVLLYAISASLAQFHVPPVENHLAANGQGLFLKNRFLELDLI